MPTFRPGSSDELAASRLLSPSSIGHGLAVNMKAFSSSAVSKFLFFLLLWLRSVQSLITPFPQISRARSLPPRRPPAARRLQHHPGDQVLSSKLQLLNPVNLLRQRLRLLLCLKHLPLRMNRLTLPPLQRNHRSQSRLPKRHRMRNPPKARQRFQFLRQSEKRLFLHLSLGLLPRNLQLLLNLPRPHLPQPHRLLSPRLYLYQDLHKQLNRMTDAQISQRNQQGIAMRP